MSRQRRVEIEPINSKRKTLKGSLLKGSKKSEVKRLPLKLQLTTQVKL